MNLHIARLNLGHIQDIVDYLQKNFTRRLNVFSILCHLIRNILPQYHLIQPDNRIDRCPYLMAHAGKKSVLRLIQLLDFFFLSLGELSIALMVVLVNMCTANNTVALITVGPIAKDISVKYDIPARRTASILDTMSCFTQGLLPYGIQTLMAVQLTSNALTPIDVVSHLYYPMLIGLAVLLSILFVKNTKKAVKT